MLDQFRDRVDSKLVDTSNDLSSVVESIENLELEYNRGKCTRNVVDCLSQRIWS